MDDKKKYSIVIFDYDSDELRNFAKANGFVGMQLNWYFRQVWVLKDKSELEMSSLLGQLLLCHKALEVRHQSQPEGEYIVVEPTNPKAPRGYLYEYSNDDGPEFRLMTGVNNGYVVTATDDDKVVLERSFTGFDSSKIINGMAMHDQSPLSCDRLLQIIRHQTQNHVEIKLERENGRTE